jgi:hypothetical protein
LRELDSVAAYRKGAGMLKDLFDFSKKRSGTEAVAFYMFYLGCFALLSAMLGFEV